MLSTNKISIRLACSADIHGSFVALDRLACIAEETKSDVMIIAGDVTSSGVHNSFLYCLEAAVERGDCPIIFTPGNHDNWNVNKYFPKSEDYISGKILMDEKSIVCLVEESVEYKEFKFWGSPYTNRFMNWYWMRDIQDMKFNIPDDTDIVITHTPIFGYHDTSYTMNKIGSEELGIALNRCRDVKLHVCGHNHTGGLIKNLVNSYGSEFTTMNCACHDDQLRFNPNGIIIVDVSKDKSVTSKFRPYNYE